MKQHIPLFVLCMLAALPIRAGLTDTVTIDNDCCRMVQFFKATLYENYGDSLAFDTFFNAYHAYDENYILQVDRDKLNALFTEIYERTWKAYLLGGYDERKARYGDNPFWDVRLSLYSLGILSLDILPSTPGGYHQRVIAKSEHPYFKMINNTAQGSREYPSYTVNNHWINYYQLDKAFRRGDKEIQLWLTFRFWPYLCRCANIDVYCGKPKEEVPDTFIMREFKLPPL